MKITNVKVEMFNWETEQWRTGVGTTFGQTRQLGIVTVETDEGVSGNAFLGSSRMGADHYSLGLIEFLKPLVMGRNPQDIGAIWWDMWKMNRSVSTNAIGAIDICLWDINGKIAGQPIHRLLGTCKESVPGLFVHSVLGDQGGVCRGGAPVPGHGVDRAQDTPAWEPEVRHRDLQGGARGRW